MLKAESDRGAILVGAAMLDEMLADLIGMRLASDLGAEQRERLFDPQGPAGSFSNRIALARALDMIPKPVAQALDMVREIRNAAAHFDHKFGAGFKLGFDTEKVVAKLKGYKLTVAGDTTRERWDGIIFELAVLLLGEETLEKHQPRRLSRDELFDEIERKRAEGERVL